jgi:hypothetical protein
MQTNKVNMSLDDIIKQNRKNKKFEGNGNRRKFGERRKYNKVRQFDSNSGQVRKLSESRENKTRLYVSNLQKEIVNSELRVCSIFIPENLLGSWNS